jgi:hypothetical protein
MPKSKGRETIAREDASDEEEQYNKRALSQNKVIAKQQHRKRLRRNRLKRVAICQWRVGRLK